MKNKNILEEIRDYAQNPNKDGKSWEAGHVPIQEIINIMESEDWKEEEFDSNGWQYDWWLTMSKGNIVATFSGSGYYGGLSVSTDYEDEFGELLDTEDL